jgi:hypothetical protein
MGRLRRLRSSIFERRTVALRATGRAYVPLRGRRGHSCAAVVPATRSLEEFSPKALSPRRGRGRRIKLLIPNTIYYPLNGHANSRFKLAAKQLASRPYNQADRLFTDSPFGLSQVKRRLWRPVPGPRCLHNGM